MPSHLHARAGHWSRRLRAVLVIAAAVAVLALPGIAAATTVVLEDTAPSRATMVGAAVQGAASVPSPSKPMAIYGTLTPTEDLDAFAFVAPRTGETSITLLLQDPLLADAFAPTLSVSEDGTSPIKAQRPSQRPPGSFDVYSFETLRPSSGLRVKLVAGRRYVVSVGPGQPSGLVIPYTVRFAGEGRTAAAVDPAGVTAIPALWTGRYAQRSFRPGAALALLVLVATAILALALAAGALIARASKRPEQEATPPIRVAVAPEPPVQQPSSQLAPDPAVTPQRRSDDSPRSRRAAVTLPSLRSRKVRAAEVSEAYVAEATRPSEPAAEPEALPVQQDAPLPGVGAISESTSDRPIEGAAPVSGHEAATQTTEPKSDAESRSEPEVVEQSPTEPEPEDSPSAVESADEPPATETGEGFAQRLKRVRHKDAESDEAERAAMPDLEDFLGAYDLERPADSEPPPSE